MTKRIYVVNDTGAVKEAECLVRASNAAQAVKHVTRNRYEVGVPSQEMLVRLVSNGVKVEEAGSDE